MLRRQEDIELAVDQFIDQRLGHGLAVNGANIEGILPIDFLKREPAEEGVNKDVAECQHVGDRDEEGDIGSII